MDEQESGNGMAGGVTGMVITGLLGLAALGWMLVAGRSRSSDWGGWWLLLAAALLAVSLLITEITVISGDVDQPPTILAVLELGCVLAAAALPLVVGGRLSRRALAARQRVQELEAASLLRSDRIAALSHDVRTPLASIRGAAYLLSEGTPGPLNERQRRFLRTIETNADHVIRLAEQLLTTSRLDAGLFTVRPEIVEVRDFTRTTAMDLRAALDRDISVDVPGPPIYAQFDPDLMRQVLINVLSNAVQHQGPSANGPVRIRAMVDECNARFIIVDHGVGMSEKDRDRIFTRFVSGAHDRGGTGLGMYIAEQIVRLHAGHIFVDTAVGRGTRITVQIPRDPTAGRSAGRRGSLAGAP